MMVPWDSDDEFWKVYNDRYGRLITQAERFILATKASPDKVMVLMRFVAPTRLSFMSNVRR